ncbi:MAG TPA: hypothetical protein VD997_10110 [Phycisphaerales bacterium]|nr:hypothetical protein [Phycisphaerales bacterium]
MDVTAKLLRVFQVDKQLRGLQSRLSQAESFLAAQNKDLSTIDTQRSALEAQVKQHAAQAADLEGEMARLDAKMATLRSQMENAQTNKEYKAFLTEINTFKADRDSVETKALEAMGKADELRKQIAELTGKRSEREQVQKVAANDRDARFKEIETRLNELKAERQKLAAEVPPEVLQMFNRLVAQRGDEAMGTIEVQDRKRHEYTCSICMMTIPVDSVSGLMSSGKLTRCKSCEAILYIDEDAKKALLPPQASKR